MKHTKGFKYGANLCRGGIVWFLAAALLALTPLTSFSAEMVSNGNFNGATGWSYDPAGGTAVGQTSAYDAAVTRTADGSGSTKVAIPTNNRQKTAIGVLTQTVAIPTGASISAVSLWADLSVDQNTGDSVTVDLRYTDLTTVNILTSGELTNTAWAQFSNAPALTLAKDVDQIIVTLNARTANNTTNSVDLWVDDLSITYTAPTPSNSYGTMTSMSGPLTADLTQQTVATVPVTLNNGGATVSSYTVNLSGTVTAGDVAGVYVTDGTNTWSATGSYGNGSSVVCSGANAIPGATLSINVTLNATAGSKTVAVTLNTDSNAAGTLPKGPSTALSITGPSNSYGSMTSMGGPLTANLSQQTVATVPVTAVLGGKAVSSYTVNLSGTVTAGDVAGVYVSDGSSTWSATGSYGNGSSVVCLGSNAVPGATLSIRVTLNATADTKTVAVTLNTDSNAAATLPKGPSTALAISAPAGPSSTINSCAGCHGYPSPLTDSASRNATTGEFVGDHAKHNYVCSTCHVTPVTETGTDYAHRDGNINIKSGTIGLTDDGTYSRGSTFAQSNSPVTGTCNSVNCHANAVTPQWGVGTTACDSCHGLPPATNAHSKHYSEKGWATGSNAMCIVCHPNNLAGHSDVTDNTVEVTLTPAGVSPAITCASATASGCHIDKTTPAWNTTNIACLACHTLGGASNNPTSGLHNVVPSVSAEQHDDSFDSAGGNCISCHTTLTAQTTHANGIFSANGSVAGDKTAMGLAAFYTATADDIGTCVNTTCHLGNSDAWAHKWMAPANYTNATNSCTGCHGMDLTVTNLGVTGVEHLAVTAKHNATATSYKCKDCHAIESASGYAFTFGSADWANRGETTLHGNNLITMNDDVAGAGGNITGWQRGTGGNTAKSLCLKCHVNWTDSAPQHWATNTLWTPQEVAGDVITSACGECHTGGVTPGGASGAHVIHGANTTDLVAGGAACVPCHGNNGGLGYQNATAGTHGNSSVNFVGVTYSTAVRNNLTGTCLTASCHNVNTNADQSTAWNTTALACDDCHYYATGTTPTTAGNTAHGRPLSADHGTHFSTGGTFACSDCHAIPAAGDTTHINGATSLADKAVAIAYEATITAAAKGTGNDQLTAGTATTCNNAACHNPSGTAYIANWDVSTSSCTLCHVATSGNPTTGDHTDHLTRSAVFGRVIVCADCHVVPVSNRHMNGLPDVQVRSVTGVFGAIATPTNAGACGTNECHNSGSATAPKNTTYQWGNATTITDCLECHENGATMATNAHNEHMNAGYTGAACTDCHTAATNTLHLNRIVNIDAAKATYSLNAGAVPIATVPNGTCLTSGCHNKTVASISWNVATGTVAGTTDLTCTSCHGNGAGAGLSTSHEAHFSAGKACTQCHGAVTTTTHINGKTSLTDGANAVLGEAGLIWTDASAVTDYTYNTTEHSCYSATNNGLGCHATAGAAGAADLTRPDWDVAFASTDCTNCHTNTTTTAVNPNSGLHNVVPTVTGVQHDSSFGTGGTCTSCHNTMPAYSTHKNGTFTGDTVANLGLRYYTQSAANTGSCVNTSCHVSNSDDWAHAWNSTAGYYTTNTTACAGCHGDKTSGFNTGVLHRSRGPHTDGTTYGCAVCHVLEAGTGNYTFTWNTNDWGGTSKHGNSTIEVNTNGTYNTTSNLCTACHSTTDGVHNFVDTGWTVANLLGDAVSGGSCTGCHGVTATTSTGAIPSAKAGAINATHKHMSIAATDEMCEVCHNSATQPMNTGSAKRDIIQLKNADTGAVIEITQSQSDITATRNLNTVTFCTSCHDSNGATNATSKVAAGTATQPFGTTAGTRVDIGTKYNSTVTGPTHSYTFNNTPALTKARSPHGKPGTNVMKQSVEQSTFTDANPVGCQHCHPAHGSTTNNAKTANWNKGGIVVGDAMMLSTYSDPDTCWGCHNNPAAPSLTTRAATWVKDYYGDNTAATVGSSNWRGTQNSQITYKQRAYKSIHQVKSGTISGTTTDTTVTNVACGICHDPHGAVTWAAQGAKQYQAFSLRGNWMTSPYLEDRAGSRTGGTATTVPGLSAKGQLETWTGPRNNAGAVWNRPATLGHGYDAAGGTGFDGYFIDDNTFGTTGTVANSVTVTYMTETVDNFGGLCASCHTSAAFAGGTTTAMQTYLKTLNNAGWAGGKIHQTVKGWSASADITDIVNATNNPKMHNYHSVNTQAPWGVLSANCYAARSTWSWGVNMTNGTKQVYHQFSCSKCHTPHASSLPRLMVSNCLDVGTGATSRVAVTSGTTRAAYTYPTNVATLSGVGTNPGVSEIAVHCHNKRSTNKSAGTGWNIVTGW